MALNTVFKCALFKELFIPQIIYWGGKLIQIKGQNIHLSHTIQFHIPLTFIKCLTCSKFDSKYIFPFKKISNMKKNRWTFCDKELG